MCDINPLWGCFSVLKQLIGEYNEISSPRKAPHYMGKEVITAEACRVKVQDWQSQQKQANVLAELISAMLVVCRDFACKGYQEVCFNGVPQELTRQDKDTIQEILKEKGFKSYFVGDYKKALGIKISWEKKP